MKKLLPITKIVILLTIFLTIVTLDFISKQWILNNLTLYESKPLISLLNFYHIHNYGAAFNVLSNFYYKRNYLLCCISCIIVLMLIKCLFQLFKKESNHILTYISYVLILSGAIGNLIDRIYFGFVIDFIDIHIENWHFATFNVADFSIFLGAILYIHHTKVLSKN